MKNQPNNNAGSKAVCKGPQLITVHSFTGKPMKEDQRKKFVDGALTIADNAANSFPKSLVVEEEWTQHQ